MGKYLTDEEVFGPPASSSNILTDDDVFGTKKGRSALGVAKDIGVSTAKGVVGLGSAAVGIGNLATGGLVGKGMDAIGYDPTMTQDFLADFYSEPQKAANRKVDEAEGFGNTVGALIKNPSTIGHKIVETLPLTFGGGGIGAVARTAIPKYLPGLASKVSPKIAGVAAGAFGEGVIGAGSMAEDIRQQLPDKELTTKGAIYSGLAGVGTSAFGFAGGRLAQKLGFADIDTMLATGSLNEAGKKAGVAEIAKRIIGGGISEGAFEELPQSIQETMFQNAALDKPIMEGVPEAAAQGLVVGAAMGAGANILPSRGPVGAELLENPTPETPPSIINPNAGAISRAASKVPGIGELLPQQQAIQDSVIIQEPAALVPEAGGIGVLPEDQAGRGLPTGNQTAAQENNSSMQGAATEQASAPVLQDQVDFEPEGLAIESANNELADRELMNDFADTQEDMQAQADTRARKAKFERMRGEREAKKQDAAVQAVYQTLSKDTSGGKAGRLTATETQGIPYEGRTAKDNFADSASQSVGPAWLQAASINKYYDEQGLTKDSPSRVKIDAAVVHSTMAAKDSGKKLTPNQEKVYEHLTHIGKQSPEGARDTDLYDLEEKGHQFDAPHEIPATALQKGDAYVVTDKNGLPEEFKVIEEHANGDITVKDGIEKRISPSETVENVIASNKISPENERAARIKLQQDRRKASLLDPARSSAGTTYAPTNDFQNTENRQAATDELMNDFADTSEQVQAQDTAKMTLRERIAAKKAEVNEAVNSETQAPDIIHTTERTLKNGENVTTSYKAITGEKDGVTTTTFKFHRSDKESTQWNNTGVPIEKTILKDYQPDAESLDSVPGSEIHSILEIRVSGKGQTAATVMMRTQEGDKFKAELSFVPKSEKIAANRADKIAANKAKPAAKVEKRKQTKDDANPVLDLLMGKDGAQEGMDEFIAAQNGETVAQMRERVANESRDAISSFDNGEKGKQLQLLKKQIADIEKENKSHDDTIKDWSSRQYKDNKTAYDKNDMHGQDAGTSTIGAANKRRKRRTIEGAQRAILDNNKVLAELTKTRDALQGERDDMAPTNQAKEPSVYIGNDEAEALRGDIKMAKQTIKEWSDRDGVSEEKKKAVIEKFTKRVKSSEARLSEIEAATADPTPAASTSSTTSPANIPTSTVAAEIADSTKGDQINSVVVTKEPWQMTAKEWAEERENIKPNVVQSNFTKASGSQAVSQIKALERLLYGVGDSDKQLVNDLQDGVKTITEKERLALIERLESPVSHRRVIEKALADGRPVPAEVLADYPWLAARESIKLYVENLKNLSDKELKAEAKKTENDLNAWSKKTPNIVNGRVNPELGKQSGHEVSEKMNAVDREIEARKAQATPELATESAQVKAVPLTEGDAKQGKPNASPKMEKGNDFLWDALPEKERMNLIRGHHSRDVAQRMWRKSWDDLTESDKGIAARAIENDAVLIRAITGDIVSVEEYPTKEVAASFDHISHSSGSSAYIHRNQFLETVQSEYESALPFAETQEQKDVLAAEVERFKEEYIAKERPTLSVRSATYSGHIAGGSKFNSKQAGQRNNALDRSESGFHSWLKSQGGRIKEAVLAARNDDQLSVEATAKDDKAAKRKAVLLKMVKSVLDFKKGDTVKFGSYNIVKVSYGKDGYPASVFVDATDLTDNKFDIAKTFFNNDKGKLRAAVDEVRAEISSDQAVAGGSLTTEKIEPTIDGHKSFVSGLYAGEIDIDGYKAHFAALEANKESIIADLNKMTKDDLLNLMGGMRAYRLKGDKKGQIVASVYDDMLDDFGLGRGLSYFMGESSGKARADQVEGTTQTDIDEFVAGIAKSKADRKAQSEKHSEAIKDPQTLEDHIALLRSIMDSGKTFKEAYKAITPEQRAAYDELSGEKSRKARGDKKDEERTRVRAAGATTGAEIIATKHTRDGHDLFVVQAGERVEREIYNEWNATARKLGGKYSSYRVGGAIPGFQFRTKEAAESFQKYVSKGDTQAVTDQAQVRRDAYADDRSQTAVERLTEMAAKLEEKADDSLGQDRKANTSRRAGMAARAEANANADKAMAVTMRNIAGAISEGEAKFLDRVRQKVQVAELQGIVNVANYARISEKYPTYAERENNKYEAPTADTADFVEFPSYTAYRSDIARIGRQLMDIPGSKKLGQRIMKVANDVTDTYIKWAKENLHLVSRYSGKNGEKAVFPSKAMAEAVIARSGFKGKAIVLPFKRLQNMIILSPSESQRLGLWDGDQDKRITLSKEIGEEIVASAGKNGVDISWHFKSANERMKRLAGMGIETPAELRAAVREFIGLREAPKEADKVKELERAMVGRQKDGLDFFPTPEATADEMVQSAGIEPGMTVLEPSAGWGHIAERIREAGVEPDVVEMSSKRQELLEAKGFKVVGRDFMDVDSKYDRIIMNPPFSDRRDAEHVQHAYSLLNPGGRLVAIMGEGVFFGQDKKAQGFRDWLESVNGTEEKMEGGTFLDPSLPVNTGVNSRMVVIEKEGAYSPVDKTKETDKGVALYSVANDAPTGDTSASGLDGDTISDKARTSPRDVFILRERSDKLGLNLKQVEVSGEKSDMLRSVGDVFGVRLVYYKNNESQPKGTGNISPSGFVYKGEGRTVYLNVESSGHLAFILGHEVSHIIGTNSPAEYQKMLADIEPFIDKAKYADFTKTLKSLSSYNGINEKRQYEEFTGDLVGRLFVDGDFWNTLAKEKPSIFRKIANAVMSVLDKLSSIVVNGSDAPGAITDIQRVNRIITDALSVYVEKHGDGGPFGKRALRFSKTPTSTGNTIANVVSELQDYLGRGYANLVRRGKLEIVRTAAGLPENVRGFLKMVAWHGTPHNVDKFSSDKIGTGEGAQAYGHGLYMASAQSVASWYRKKLSVGTWSTRAGVLSRSQIIDKLAAKFNLEPNVAQRKATRIMEGIEFEGTYPKYVNSLKYNDIPIDVDNEALRLWPTKNKGNLYQVELAPAETDYLLWDKPLSEQSEKVKTALKDIAGNYQINKEQGGWTVNPVNPDGFVSSRKVGKDPVYGSHYFASKEEAQTWIDNNPTATSPYAMDYYKKLAKEKGSDKAASAYLHSLGIRGIKYLDGTSRNKGEGDSNFVIFDENDIQITAIYSKNGQIAGAYDPSTGKTYLISDAIKSGEAAQVFLHEAGHALLREDKTFMAARSKILADFGKLARINPAVKAAFAKVPKDTATGLKGEEALMYFIQDKTNHQAPLYKRIIAAVKAALFRMGIPVGRLNETDLVALFTQGAKSWSRQKGTVKESLMVGDDAVAGSPLLSVAENSPISLSSLEETAKAMASSKGSITFLKNSKVDSTFLDRVLSTPEYYFKKFAASGRVLQAALLRQDLRYEKETKVLGGFVEFVQKLRKTNKAAYTEANDYLVETDQTGDGWRMKSKDDSQWTVVAPKWAVEEGGSSIVGVFTDEAKAVTAMMAHEGQTLKEHGHSAEAIEAIRQARELTNRGFDIMAADMREIIAKAKESGNDNPFAGDGDKIDESGRYGVYAAGKKKPVALFATEQEANEALDRAAQMISYTVVSKKKGVKDFRSELKAKSWAKKHGGTVQGQKVFGNLTVKRRSSADMRPLTVKEALAQMGDLRGTFFPRIRDSGAYVLIAKKEGENSIRKNFDLPMAGDSMPTLQAVLGFATPIGREAKRLKMRGFNVTIEKDKTPSEDIFEGTNLVTAIDAVLQSSMETINPNDSEQVKAGQHINMILTMQAADLIKGRGYLSSRISRSGGDMVWEGYEMDMGKAITQYGKNVAAGSAKRETSAAMVMAFSGRDYSWNDYKNEVDKPDWTEYKEIVEKRRIDERLQKNLFRDVRSFMIDILRNDEQADRIMGTLKGLAVIKFLGFRISSATVNMTNMVLGVPATISGLTGDSITKALGRVTEAAVVYGKYRSGIGTVSAEDRAIFEHISAKGWDEAKFNHDALSEMRGQLGDAWNKFGTASMYMFGAAEKANRAMTLFAAYKATGDWDKAKDISDRSHGIYGKETIPAWARGKYNPLRLTYTFQKFQHNYMLNFVDLGFNRREYKAAAYLLLSPALLAGAGATIAAPILFAMAGALGIGGDDPEEEFYKWAEETFGGGRFARMGAFGSMGINIKGSLSMNLPMPADIGKAGLKDMLGAPAAVIGDTGQGFAHLFKGELAKGVEKLLPTAFGNASKALRESTEGVTTGNYGTIFYGSEPLKADTMDAFIRFLSFNPARLSGIREMQWNEKEVAARYQKEKSEIYSQIKRSQIAGKKPITPEILKTIKVYNDRVMESGRRDIKPITAKSIRLMLRMNARASKFERGRIIDPDE